MATPVSIANPSFATGKVLIIDHGSCDMRRVANVLRAVVNTVDIGGSLAELADPADYALVIVNYDTLTAEEREQLLPMLPALRDRCQVLVFSQSTSKDDLAVLFGTHGITNLLAISEAADNDEFLVTVQKILQGEIFGIEKYFPWGSKSVRCQIASSQDARNFTVEAKNFVTSIGIPSRLAESFVIVADELAMNAIYNAPTDGQEPRYHGQPRDEDVALLFGEIVTGRLYYDGRRLGVSICDPFGSLSPEKVTSYLAKCFRGGNDQINWGSGGAGLGLYQAYQALSHFVINISQGKRTEFIGILDVRGSYRDFVKKGKSFNIFVEDQQ